jgi:F0F1-type ATP synthase assembly protein I
MTEENSLENRIKDAHENSTIIPKEERIDKNKQAGMQAGGEFMAYVIAGALAGWGLDSLLNTKPFLLILFLFAGFCLGIYRSSQVYSKN